MIKIYCFYRLTNILLIFTLFCAIGCHELGSFIQRNYVQLVMTMN